jgi:hypothetical protein
MNGRELLQSSAARRLGLRIQAHLGTWKIVSVVVWSRVVVYTRTLWGAVPCYNKDFAKFCKRVAKG